MPRLQSKELYLTLRDYIGSDKLPKAGEEATIPNFASTTRAFGNGSPLHHAESWDGQFLSVVKHLERALEKNQV